MNRRAALWTSLLLGGWLPGRLVSAQQQAVPRVRDDRGKPAPRTASIEDDPPPERSGQEAGYPADDHPADFPGQPGFQWRTFAIEKYTRIAQGQSTSPQDALVEWIFRRTGSAVWHGEKPAVLSASRGRILAYHDARTLDQVEEVVERFTNSVADLISLRVRIVAAVDPRWRYAIYSRLNLIDGGPSGQQIWTAKVEDAALVLTQMSTTQGFRMIAEQEYKVVNGQTLSIKALLNKDYAANLQRASATGLGYQTGTRQVAEGIALRMSPLLNFEGDQIELALDLRADTIRALHATKVLAPREVGSNEMNIDVPEIAESRLNQTIPDWPIDRTLIISAGILPGILQDRSGILSRLQSWNPGATELLVFLDARVASLTPTPAPGSRPSNVRARPGGVAPDRGDDDSIRIDDLDEGPISARDRRRPR